MVVMKNAFNGAIYYMLFGIKWECRQHVLIAVSNIHTLVVFSWSTQSVRGSNSGATAGARAFVLTRAWCRNEGSLMEKCGQPP